jgi:hypothetical protein
MFVAGHLFGIGHDTVHWVKNKRGRKYSTTTTTDIDKALKFETKDEAGEFISAKVSKLNENSDHYCFCYTIQEITE